MSQEEEAYRYTYSAKQQAEVEQIRLKYLPTKENPMEQLRLLDQKVTQKGTLYSILLGVISTVVFGLGLTFCLVWSDYFILGLVLDLVGLLGIGGAYPLYVATVKKEHQKLAPDILKLAEELLK